MWSVQSISGLTMAEEHTSILLFLNQDNRTSTISWDALKSWIAGLDTLAPVLWGLCLLFLSIGCWIIYSRNNKSKAQILDAPGFPPVEPLKNFDWETAEPVKIRPFKPKYHLTMALEKLNPSELILMDKTYRDRLALRKSLLGEQHDIVVAVNNDSDPRVREAVWELYTFLLGTYLPGRYPTMFKLHHQTRRLENLVTGEMWPVVPADTDPTILPLETLVKIVDEDFLFLLPEEQNQKDDKKKEPKYILEAYSTCFPSGFNPRKKLGLLLANIHGPVPHYREKLERSMDKFFAKVEVGKYVRRVNWTVTTNAELFAAFGGTHAAVDEELEKIQPGELDVDQTILRCERQTLHRLPKSKALVFAFHTYVYPIQSIKDEGLGEELARAIDGLKEGSAPRMHIYKRGAVWGEAVKAFLRS